jgi:hypothetical protein
VSDMRAVIQPKSDQLNTDSLLGAPITITITNVAIRPGTEQPISIEYEGDNSKPFKPCKSMARVMVHCWGDDAKVYIGHSMRLYADPKVKWGGLEVGGIRISHMSHIDRAMTLALTESKAKRQLFTVLPLVAEKPPENKKPTPKEIADGIVMRFNRAADIDAHNELLSDDIVSKQIAWLKDKQPTLHGPVDEAIKASVARHTGITTDDDGGTLDL